MKITYDPDKRRVTLEQRGLDFDEAWQVFAGLHYTRQDNRFDYGEVRQITVGMVGDDLVIVVWTERDDSRRVISMRKADRDERKAYYDRLD